MNPLIFLTSSRATRQRPLSPATEQLIRNTGVAFTFLRDSLHLDYVPFLASALDIVSAVVPRLTGHPAQTLAQFLSEHPESYAHLL